MKIKHLTYLLCTLINEPNVFVHLNYFMESSILEDPVVMFGGRESRDSRENERDTPFDS